MDKNQLINSAQEISPPSESVAQEYGSKLETLVASVNKSMLQRKDLITLVGKDNEQMMKDNHSNHARFIESILLSYDPNTLTETVLWVFRAYRSKGFSDNYWCAQLNLWISTLKENLSENSYNEIIPIYKWMQINIPHFVNIANAELDKIK